MARNLDESQVFADYVAAGEARSYAALAQKYRISKRSIVRMARRNDWTARLAKIEADARRQADQRLTENRAEVRERHLKLVRFLTSRSVQGLQAHAFDTARDSARALEAALKLERTILGEPNDEIGVTIRELTRREVESFLAHEDEADDE